MHCLRIYEKAVLKNREWTAPPKCPVPKIVRPASRMSWRARPLIQQLLMTSNAVAVANTGSLLEYRPIRCASEPLFFFTRGDRPGFFRFAHSHLPTRPDPRRPEPERGSLLGVLTFSPRVLPSFSLPETKSLSAGEGRRKKQRSRAAAGGDGAQADQQGAAGPGA